MAHENPARLTFGKNIREHIGRQLRGHIDGRFGGNLTEAAANLGISKQRLFSYTSARSFPRADVIDLIGERWGLDLVGKRNRLPNKGDGIPPVQLGLFDQPVTLTNDQMTVVIERKGPSLAVRIEIAAQARIV
jgi:hypothetical protein